MVESVDRNGYTGKSGQKIAVNVRKKGFSVKEVTARLTTSAGVHIEQGPALEEIPGVWIYRTTVDVPDVSGVILSVTSLDTNGEILQQWLSVSTTRDPFSSALLRPAYRNARLAMSIFKDKYLQALTDERNRTNVTWGSPKS